MMTKVHTIMKMNISRYSPYQGRSLLSTALECPSLLHIQIVCSRKTNHSFERLITIVGSIASNWKTPKHDSGIYGDNPIANIYGSPYGYDINASSSLHCRLADSEQCSEFVYISASHWQTPHTNTARPWRCCLWCATPKFVWGYVSVRGRVGKYPEGTLC